MKHQNLFRSAGIVLALFASTVSFGQESKTNLPKTEPIINVASSISDAASDLALLKNLKATNERMYRNFTRMFESASEIHIFPFEKTTALYCKVNGIQNNILFTNKGTWLHTVRNYGIEKLPSEVRGMVAAEFPRYTMLRVAEVSTPAGTAYLVDIENRHEFKTIRVVNGEWDIYRKFTKE